VTGGWLNLYGSEAAPQAGGALAVHVGAGTEGERRALGLARRLADALGVYVIAAIPATGAVEPARTGVWGADKAVVFGSLSDVVAQEAPQAVLFCPSAIEAAARLAERIDRSLIGPAFEVSADPSERGLVSKVRRYGGRQIEEVTAGEWSPQLIVLDSAALPPAVEDPARSAEVVRAG
jgi:hypothetical protein